LKRSLIPLVTIAALALGPSALASAKHRPTVKLGSSSLGKILENGSGRTLYMFTKDGRNKDKCVAIQFCKGTWPLLTTKTKPVAGPGVKSSKLGTITLAHGVKQVTYAGHPLYTYSGDFMAGETDYVGAAQFGGTWYAVNAAGNKVK
jgi:predicted lipoprotein with Yx(FWY)xxD motif